jgi:hypothetical protein
MRPLTSVAVVSALQLTLLAGCGSGHGPGPSTTPSQVARKAARPGDSLGREFVAAVPSVKPGTPPIPVQVKFALHEHPQAGQAAAMDLALIATTGTLDHLAAKVRGEDGLVVTAGEEVPGTQKPVEGVPVRAALQLMPKQDGIYELTVDVTVDAGAIVSNQSFSIPVVVGNGIADLPTTGTVSAPVAATKPPAGAPGH